MSGSDVRGAAPAAIPNERAFRRPEWCRGEAVTFPDGQRWQFARPVPRRIVESGKAAVFWDFGVGLLDEETCKALNRGFYRLLRKSLRARNDFQRAAANLELAWFLLARNYVVTQDDFQDLLYAAGEAPALWAAIVRHVESVIDAGAKVLAAEPITNG